MGKKLINGYCMFLCLFLACAASCTAKRIISSTREESAIQTQINGNIETYKKEISQSVLHSTLEEHFGKMRTISFRVYDTKKTPDSIGNYPLLVDGVIQEETENTKTISNADTLIVTKDDTTSVVITNKTDIKQGKDEFNYTKKNNPQWYSLVTLLCVIAFVFFVIKIFPRQ